MIIPAAKPLASSTSRSLAPRAFAPTRDRNRARLVAFGALLVATSVVFSAIAPAAAGVVGLRSGTAPIVEASTGAYPEQWTWPVPAPIRVVSPFRAPPTPYASGHRGIDLVAESGAPVVAAEAGTVSFAGMVAGRGVVAIDHGDGVVSAIEPVAAAAGITEGSVVDAGDRIGTIASGGHCSTGCAHFGVRVHGEYVSPFLFLGGLPRAVLLPFG